MPYEIVWESSGAHKRFSGHVTEREFIASSEEIAGDERFDRLRYIISDYSPVTSHGITSQGVETVAAIRLGSSHTNPNIRSALVAKDTSPGSIGELATLQPFLNLNQTTMFASLEQAREWLGIQPQLNKFRDLRVY